MADVLACIDGSAYANSVCDHAGWFASDPDVGVEVLHVTDGPPTAATATLVDRAVWRLRDEGVGPVTSAQATGGFVKVASKWDADIIVMGKRGDTSETKRQHLGANVDAMVRATQRPLCLTSKVFLPIHRALLLLDADVNHRRSVEFVISQARLSDLSIDALIMAGPADEQADAKVEWVREALDGAAGDIFSLQAEGLDHAVVQYMESRAADLVVVSRAVIAPDPETRLRQIEERGVWGMRTPVLIC